MFGLDILQSGVHYCLDIFHYLGTCLPRETYPLALIHETFRQILTLEAQELPNFALSAGT